MLDRDPSQATVHYNLGLVLKQKDEF